MTMVEKVARAIHEAHAETGWPADECETCDELARVAIAALREPTEKMLQAAEREWDGRLSFRCTGAWRAMINAALAE